METEDTQVTLTAEEEHAIIFVVKAKNAALILTAARHLNARMMFANRVLHQFFLQEAQEVLQAGIQTLQAPNHLKI